MENDFACYYCDIESRELSKKIFFYVNKVFKEEGFCTCNECTMQMLSILEEREILNKANNRTIDHLKKYRNKLIYLYDYFNPPVPKN